MGLSAPVTLADLPNIFIMIAALIALFIMLVIFLRNMEFIGIVGEGATQPWPGAMRPPRLLMQRVHIPFTFQLLEPHTISYTGGVRCTVSSTVPYWHASWWGAPVRQLHATLWGSPQDMRAARPDVRKLITSSSQRACSSPLDNDDDFEILYRHCINNPSSLPHDEQLLQMACERPPRLGPPPRACYPLVVILAREPADTHDLRPDDTVALVTVIHIQDDQCALPSGIIAQYLKQANGHLSCLKRLYVAGECPAEQDGYTASVAEEGALCCVCASQPLSRALLPCRHACLCADCQPKLDKCPICRSAISSYFCIKNEEEPLSDLKQQRFPFNRRILDLFHYH